MSGEGSQRLRLRTLVTHLDTPLDLGGDMQLRYLGYADAENIDGGSPRISMLPRSP